MSVKDAALLRFNGDLKGAGKILNDAYASNPLDTDVWHEMAACCLAAKDYQRAEEILTAIHDVKPTDPGPCYQIGGLLDTTGQWERAAYWLKLAADRATEPHQLTGIWKARGDVRYKLGKPKEAAIAWDKALDQPSTNDGPSNFAKAEMLLARGQWAEGWRLFEYRWATAEAWRMQKTGHQTPIADMPPEWDGKAPGRVLVAGEQGTGDVIQMLRYARRIPNVVVQCQPELVRFAGTHFPDSTGTTTLPVVANGVREIVADWSVPIMSLPFKLGMGPIGTLERLFEWERRDPEGKLRVGVCWKGSKDHLNDVDRSCPFSLMPFVEAIPSVEAVSLQHGEPTKFRDFLATAEVVESCDVVFTVDTAVMHLAGTLGVPTFCIPPTLPELRFPLTHEDTTPWYPSVRVFRRRDSRDWLATVRRVVTEITRMVEER